MNARLVSRTAVHVLDVPGAPGTARTSLCGLFGAWRAAAAGEPVSCPHCARLARVEIAAASELRRRAPAPSLPRVPKMRGRVRGRVGLVGWFAPRALSAVLHDGAGLR